MALWRFFHDVLNWATGSPLGGALSSTSLHQRLGFILPHTVEFLCLINKMPLGRLFPWKDQLRDTVISWWRPFINFITSAPWVYTSPYRIVNPVSTEGGFGLLMKLLYTIQKTLIMMSLCSNTFLEIYLGKFWCKRFGQIWKCTTKRWACGSI